MDGDFDDLDGGVVAGLDGGVGWERHLWEAEASWVGVLGGADDLEDGHHGEGHVGGAAGRAVGAESEVYVEEGGGVALEPTWWMGEGC